MTHLKGWVIDNPWGALVYACAIFWAVVAATVALVVL